MTSGKTVGSGAASQSQLVAFNSPEEWIAAFGANRPPTTFTIGNFDGVHLGHQQVLQTLVKRAQRSHSLSAVLTFFPHPARVLRPENAPLLLMTLPQRLDAFRNCGIDAALVLGFNSELAKVSAEQFAQRFLVETLRANAVLIGENFRFGHRQEGDAKHLEEFGRRWGFEVQIVPPVVQDGIVVSSTAVRNAVRDGRMDITAQLLGRRFALAGEIKTGTGQGRKLVVPTLNLSTEQECLPKNGVYATETKVEGKTYHSATNIGMRPTFGGQRLAIESHLFDFSENLTSGAMQIRFWKRLRDEQEFSGPEALREQVLRDIRDAQFYFVSLAQPT